MKDLTRSVLYNALHCIGMNHRSFASTCTSVKSESQPRGDCDPTAVVGRDALVATSSTPTIKPCLGQWLLQEVYHTACSAPLCCWLIDWDNKTKVCQHLFFLSYLTFSPHLRARDPSNRKPYHGAHNWLISGATNSLSKDPRTVPHLRTEWNPLLLGSELSQRDVWWRSYEVSLCRLMYRMVSSVILRKWYRWTNIHTLTTGNKSAPKCETNFSAYSLYVPINDNIWWRWYR